MIVFLLVPVLSIVAAVFLTRKRAELVVPRWERRLVPAESGSAYRDAAMTARLEALPETHATASLPKSTRDAASLLRLAVCLASMFVFPIGAAVLLEPRVGAIFWLGLPGLALAAGQLAARRSLLSASPASPSIATGVGIWTIAHNLVVVAAVYVCGMPGTTLTDGDWSLLPMSSCGVAFVVYAACSFILGVITLNAAGPQLSWLREHSALSSAPASVTA